ncbi:MAG: CRTAC1 family protein [Candidatus Latescibacteria bacterium]|nr:CRTAC1 family protein [Candidatus Latescibacterota bacterium]
MMGGAAFFDYDRDGDPDLYVTNGSRFEGFPAGQHPTNHLYRNDGGVFVDVTADAAVGDTSWSMGCAVADYDNDGDEDLYVTNFGRNTLYRNKGDSTFEDATVLAGVGDRRWGTGCTWGDYDLDGDVDLFVANYVDFSLEYRSTIPCLWKNLSVYCGPRGLLPAADVLYRNEGNGTFVDVSAAAGVDKVYYGMAASFGDFDNDGWPDLFVADDSTPNLLYHNQKDGTFAEMAIEAGVAYNGEGVTQGSMGLALGDYDNDGLEDIFVTNFADEYNALYRNSGDLFFYDVSFETRIASVGTREVAWGTTFFDFDNDADQDLFVANGHTYPQADLPEAESSYREKNILFENQGNGRFVDVSAQAGPGLAISQVSRGVCAADYDNDGDVDLFVLNLNSLPTLLRNEGTRTNNYLTIQTVGTRSNRDGIGARLTLHAGGQRQVAWVQSGGSYLSQSDLRVHFGLGKATVVDSLEVRWPSGAVQALPGVAVNQVLVVREPP